MESKRVTYNILDDLKQKIDSYRLLQFKDRVYVPQIEAVKSKIMQINYNNLLGGYKGQ